MILPFWIREVTWPLKRAFLWEAVLPNFLYLASFYSFLNTMVYHLPLIGLTQTTHGFHLWVNTDALIGLTVHAIIRLGIYQSSALWSSKPSSLSLSKTSSRDLRPRLRTFIISSGVLLTSSATVLIPALLRQLYERTESSSSSILISTALVPAVSGFSSRTAVLS